MLRQQQPRMLRNFPNCLRMPLRPFLWPFLPLDGRDHHQRHYWRALYPVPYRFGCEYRGGH